MKLRRCSTLFLVLVLAWTSALFGAATDDPSRVIDVSTADDQLSLNAYADYWVDERAHRDIKDVIALARPAWQSNIGGALAFGQSDAAYWFRVPLKGLSEIRMPRFFQISYSPLDEVDVYYVRGDGVVGTYSTGDTRPYDRRPMDHPNFLFPLEPDAEDNMTLYVRVATEGILKVPMELLSQSGLTEQESRTHLGFGIYFGIMLLMMAYNGILFLAVRDANYLYYVFYIAAIVSLQFTITGLGFMYLWPDTTGLNNTLTILFTGLMPFAAIVFVWRFIGLSTVGSRLDRITCLMLCAGFCVVLAGSVMLPYTSALKLAHTLAFLTVIFGFYLGVKYWLQGIKSARIFTLAWFSYLVFILIYLAELKNWIEPSFLSQHALALGSIIEVALLSLAFADRLNEEKDLRLRDQMERNQSLDNLVRARTEELEAANFKLKELSTTDGLTGLYNRRHFDEVFVNEHRRAYRDKHPISLVMIDLDHFKAVNDTYGHAFGDTCLKHLADIVLQFVRRPPDLAARYGGEEFVILLPQTDNAGARHVAEQIRGALEAKAISDGTCSVCQTGSFGVATEIPTELSSHTALLQAADQCLYQAKAEGRNRVTAVVCHEDTGKTAERVDLSSDGPTEHPLL